jgi:hypothetical protein
MRRIIRCFAISGLTGACFTSAVVLAQVGGAAPPTAQAPAAEQPKKAEAKKAGRAVPALPGAGESAVEVPAADDKEANLARIRAVTEARVEAARLKAATKKGTLIEKADAPGRLVQLKAVAQPAQLNRAPLIQQFTNQARPLLRAELLFARNVCQLNREELRKINREAQVMLDEVVGKLVDAQFQPRARMVVVQGRVNLPQGLDSQQLLHDGVVAVMKKNLSDAQWSRYEAEMQKRDENRKRATISYLVDAIDRELYLTPEQCDRLEAALKDHWESAWTMYLENHLFGNKHYPTTIDALVTPLLSDAQRKVWAGVPKVGIYWGFAGMLAGFANDVDGLEVELGEPARRGQEPNARMGVMKMEVQAVQGMIIESKVGVPAAPAKKAGKKKAGAGP